MCSFTAWRGWNCCTCLAAWLPVFEELAQDRGDLTGSVKILQLRGGNPNSGGTHTEGGVFDLGYYHDGQADALVYLARQMGADATWFREWDGNHHVHGVLTGCPRNDPAAYQIEAVKDGFNGLGYMGQDGPDDGPQPLSGRTWEQGIEWAEDQMSISEADIDKIAAQVWAQQLARDGRSYSAGSWVTLASTASDQTRDALIGAVEEVASQVWATPVTRDGRTYGSGSWLTLAATAADETRDDVNTATLDTEVTSLAATGIPAHLAAILVMLSLLLGGALTLGIVR
jgi:hypothetical protein